LLFVKLFLFDMKTQMLYDKTHIPFNFIELGEFFLMRGGY